ncbi:hypothetical protein BCV70DRAFT_200685 [Testicularia cyperi]|uniref:Uncharacterized protein n=1 Tax=Testicularia cyperi TaxID=1882483 RepID=A0A317XN57_9BASI|nr:hypothetical protein BCV70DRAFT_200685 [Testicularia cyperi]
MPNLGHRFDSPGATEPIPLRHSAQVCFPLTSLPPELQSLVLRHALESTEPSSLNVLVVCKTFLQLGLPHLYRRVTLASRHSLSCFVRTLKQQPQHARYIRALEVYSARLHWNDAVTMARIIDRVQSQSHDDHTVSDESPAAGAASAKVSVLRVRFPASEIVEALDFFQHFSPTSFEWITQPCWLLRPGEVFMRFLNQWSTTLQSLTLGNFEYDETFARGLCRMPHLRELKLLGSCNKMLSPQTLRILLASGQTRHTLRWLYIGDCPLRRRSRLELDLGTAIPTYEHGEGAQKIPSSRQQVQRHHQSHQTKFETTAGCVKFCPRCRILARERVMERYGSRDAATDEAVMPHANVQHSTADTRPSTSAPSDPTNADDHARLLRRRVMESLRWLPH